MKPPKTWPEEVLPEEQLERARRTPIFTQGILAEPWRVCCATESTNHGNCPNPVEWAVNINDREMWLCNRCHQNVKDGAYGKNLKILAEINLLAIRQPSG